MKEILKKSARMCLSPALVVCAVQFFQHLGVWGVGDLLVTFFWSYLIATLVVAAVIWLWCRLHL